MIAIIAGKYHAAALTNNQEWEDALVAAGQTSGDLVHPLPYSPELHFAEFASAVADMKNSVAVSILLARVIIIILFICLFFYYQFKFFARCFYNLFKTRIIFFLSLLIIIDYI